MGAVKDRAVMRRRQWPLRDAFGPVLSIVFACTALPMFAPYEAARTDFSSCKDLSAVGTDGDGGGQHVR